MFQYIHLELAAVSKVWSGNFTGMESSGHHAAGTLVCHSLLSWDSSLSCQRVKRIQQSIRSSAAQRERRASTALVFSCSLNCWGFYCKSPAFYDELQSSARAVHLRMRFIARCDDARIVNSIAWILHSFSLSFIAGEIHCAWIMVSVRYVDPYLTLKYLLSLCGPWFFFKGTVRSNMPQYVDVLIRALFYKHRVFCHLISCIVWMK